MQVSLCPIKVSQSVSPRGPSRVVSLFRLRSRVEDIGRAGLHPSKIIIIIIIQPVDSENRFQLEFSPLLYHWRYTPRFANLFDHTRTMDRTGSAEKGRPDTRIGREFRMESARFGSERPPCLSSVVSARHLQRLHMLGRRKGGRKGRAVINGRNT